jgi:murein L,D-transpeptidase YcbB/YkuD
MMRRLLLLSVVLAACGERPEARMPPPTADLTPAEQVAEALRTRLERAGTPMRLEVRGDSIMAVASMPRFYERRAYQPAWASAGRPSAVAGELPALLRRADLDGLRPADYHLEALERLVDEGGAGWDAARLADLDLLLTDAFLLYGSHLLSGRINPETLDPEWRANRRGTDLVPVLERALDGEGVAAALDGLRPPQEGYRRLRDVLRRYRAVAADGGWPVVPPGPTLRLGARDARVPSLRQRLALSGDLADLEAADPQTFDAALERAVRRFQGRHGLEVSGVVDAAAIEALNAPVEQRTRQLELNLERWRWLPQHLGTRHILVNIAAFALDVVEDGRPVLDMRVVVGRPYRRTPVFSDTLRYLVLSPTWHVPRNIAVQDKLPQIKRDPGYLAAQRMRVYLPHEGALTELDPATVDWANVTAARFPYVLRQDPGPLNALGRVKFMFPNSYTVYLHDTPTRDLFARAERDFSSGCIRIERPIELAEYLLRDDPRWTRQAILGAVGAGVERTVWLRTPIPVHLLFWTAWADEEGVVQFRKDLYGRDARLDAALRAPPPA